MGRDVSGSGFQKERDRGDDTTLSAEPRLHREPLVCSPGHVEEVFDLLNCGPRARFVVRDPDTKTLLTVHNCTQAVARDVLATALVNLEAAGYPVVMHVHDEALVERVDPTSSEAVASIMSQPLAWTGGLPLKVAGTTMNRYRKD